MKIHERMCKDYVFFPWCMGSLVLFFWTMPSTAHMVLAWGTVCVSMIGLHMILKWRNV